MLSREQTDKHKMFQVNGCHQIKYWLWCCYSTVCFCISSDNVLHWNIAAQSSWWIQKLFFIYFVEPPLCHYMFGDNRIFHSLPFAVTYRRDRTIREAYDDRFLGERPAVSVYSLSLFSITFRNMHIPTQVRRVFFFLLKHAKPLESFF